jgi:hypothetical protein
MAVIVSQKMMTAFYADDLKPQTIKRFDELLAIDPRQFSHIATVTRCTPKNSRFCGLILQLKTKLNGLANPIH